MPRRCRRARSGLTAWGDDIMASGDDEPHTEPAQPAAARFSLGMLSAQEKLATLISSIEELAADVPQQALVDAAARISALAENAPRVQHLAFLEEGAIANTGLTLVPAARDGGTCSAG